MRVIVINCFWRWFNAINNCICHHCHLIELHTLNRMSKYLILKLTTLIGIWSFSSLGKEPFYLLFIFHLRFNKYLNLKMSLIARYNPVIFVVFSTMEYLKTLNLNFREFCIYDFSYNKCPLVLQYLFKQLYFVYKM